MDINWTKAKNLLCELGFVRLFRWPMFVVCSAVLLYQVSQVSIDYYEYKTVVQIRIGKTDTNEKNWAPGVTVCKKLTSTLILKILRLKDKNFDDKLRRIYKFRAEDREPNGQTSAQEAAEDEFDNIEMISKFFDNQNTMEKFYDLIKDELDVNCTDVTKLPSVKCEFKTFTIHSFTNRRICLTFYSELFFNYNNNDSNYNISENYTEKVDNQESLFAYLSIYNPDNDVYVHIHTSKSMPDINLEDLEMFRSRLFKNKTYGLVFDKTFVTRLEPPYITKCYDYRKVRNLVTDPIAAIEMALSEFGCIERCKKRYWKSSRQTSRCLPMDLGVVMDSNDKDHVLCNCTVKRCDKQVLVCERCPEANTDYYKKWVKDCENGCLEDCLEEYYNKHLFELTDDFKQELWNKMEVPTGDPQWERNRTVVFMASKYVEELSYTHAPKMNSFDLFASLGGLFSLWVGASVMSVYNVGVQLWRAGKSVRKRVIIEKQSAWRKNTLQKARQQHFQQSYLRNAQLRAPADLTKYAFR